MIGKAANIHATAIVVETTGLIFVGPSGSGKSSLAFSCLAEARALGLSAVLVADDQVFLSLDGADVVARCPPTIAGLMEVRGTGIISLPYQSQAVLHYAVMPHRSCGCRPAAAGGRTPRSCRRHLPAPHPDFLYGAQSAGHHNGENPRERALIGPALDTQAP